MATNSRPLRERFDEKFIPEPNSGCWLWLGGITAGGYGVIHRGGGLPNQDMAHRVAYELYVEPIPEGLCIDHKCRNRLCVNPQHLEPVTYGENISRGLLSALKPKRTHCGNGHKLTPETTAWRTYSSRGKQYRRLSCKLCESAATRRYVARKRVA